MTQPNAAIRRAGQSLTPGDLVALYVVDLSPIGVNQQFAFTPATKKTSALVFQGVTYQPVDVKCEGFEYTGKGAMPRPKISVANATRLMSSASVLYEDLIGAKLVRTRTYAQFLDGGATPDPEAAYAQDIYFFDQKTAHTKRQIEWSLASAMDQEGRRLPGRLIVREICLWRTRRWDATAGVFVYEHAKCPYTGTPRDIDGNPTTPDKEVFSRQINTCCKARFGAGAQLPFGGFPGVGRVRI